jgi:DNA-binding LacI/PurR family transcriptional regulator
MRRHYFSRHPDVKSLKETLLGQTCLWYWVWSKTKKGSAGSLSGHEAAAYDMVKYLIENGHKDIGIINVDPLRLISERNAVLLFEGIADFGLEYHEEWSHVGDFTIQADMMQ